jgi:hypothetical protein
MLSGWTPPLFAVPGENAGHDSQFTRARARAQGFFSRDTVEVLPGSGCLPAQIASGACNGVPKLLRSRNSPQWQPLV